MCKGAIALAQGTFADWNSQREPKFQISKVHDITEVVLEGLAAVLKESYALVQSGDCHLVGIQLLDGLIAKDYQKNVENAIQESLSGNKNSFVKLRTGSKPENRFWHIHPIRCQWDSGTGAVQNFEELFWNTQAITINVTFQGHSTQFTARKNIVYHDIDFDEDMESCPEEASIGNFLRFHLLEKNHIFIPPTGTILIFNDCVIHCAPEDDTRRQYLIAGNVPFPRYVDDSNPYHQPLPDIFRPDVSEDIL